MANIAVEENGQSARYRFDRLGVGFCVPVKDEYVAVASDAKDNGGVKLDLISAQVLAASEKCLKGIIQVAQLDTLTIVDAQSIFLCNGEHCDRIVRHLVRLEPRDGKIETLVWLLEKDGEGGHRVVDNTVQLLPAGFVEDRVINVKSSEFLLGIPTSRAFAMVRLPQGEPVDGTSQFRQLAAKDRFTAESLRELSRQATEMLRIAGKAN
jgi:hypothetical protein